jgi:hypothetical protein
MLHETAGDFGERQVHVWIDFVALFFRGLLNPEFATAHNLSRVRIQNMKTSRGTGLSWAGLNFSEEQRSQCRLQNPHQAARR